MPDTLKAYLQLLRFPALFTAWSNILAAHLIATGGAMNWPLLGLLIGASSALYLGGMVLNDCFDYQEDLRERPQRPLPSGRIERRTAWSLAGGLLITGCLLAGLAGSAQLTIALLLTVTIVAYDGWLKHYAIGTLTMGACRYLNWLLGLSVLPLSLHAYLLPLPILLYITALTLLSRSETRGGDRRAFDLAMLGIVCSALTIGLLYATHTLLQPWPVIPGLLLLFFLLRSLWNVRREMSPRLIQKTMKLLLLGIIPLDAFLVFAAGPWWGGIEVLLLLVPGYLLARVIYIT